MQPLFSSFREREMTYGNKEPIPLPLPFSSSGKGCWFLGGLARLPRRAKLREVSPPKGANECHSRPHATSRVNCGRNPDNTK
jgi:hypothetical protein